MKHLKIMVKETKEKERALTLDELLELVSKIRLDYMCCYDGVVLDCGLVASTYQKSNSPYGWGTFRTETIREATPEEEDAWWLLRRANGIEEAALTYAIDIKGHIALDAVTVGSAKQLLAGKEVYPELVDE